MSSGYKVILFYKFIEISGPNKLKQEQKNLCFSLNLKGRILIAEEGINATLEGKTNDINKYEKLLRKYKLFKDVVFKESASSGQAFSKLEVKVRDEVVTLGNKNLDIKKDTAKKITAEDFEKLYAKAEDFVVLDLRNDYELQAGLFDKTVSLSLKNFRDLPGKIPSLEPLKNKKVIAVCTGGIRCEKATALLKNEGFKDLYQLKDGIHSYMEKYPGKHFKGSLFVFDNRMTTTIVDVKRREIVGKCNYCNKKSEDFYSDDSVRPSKKVICCNSCIKKHFELRSCKPIALATY